jgi:hypothetical protein
MLTIEVVWNREFDWRHYYSGTMTIEHARKMKEDLLNLSDGEAVKKVRILLNNEEVK